MLIHNHLYNSKLTLGALCTHVALPLDAGYCYPRFCLRRVAAEPAQRGVAVQQHLAQPPPQLRPHGEIQRAR